MILQLKKVKPTPADMLKIAYIVVLAASVFYVRSVLISDTFEVSEKPVVKPAFQKREVGVTLNVVLEHETKEYKIRLTNLESVEDMLRELRDSQGLYYEKDLYTYGTEISSVFDTPAAEGKRWAVFYRRNDITSVIADTRLVNRGVYTLTQIRKPIHTSVQ